MKTVAPPRQSFWLVRPTEDERVLLYVDHAPAMEFPTTAHALSRIGELAAAGTQLGRVSPQPIDEGR